MPHRSNETFVALKCWGDDGDRAETKTRRVAKMGRIVGVENRNNTDSRVKGDD